MMLADELRDADIVLVHEWNEPEVASAILSLQKALRISCAVSRHASSGLHQSRARFCGFRCIMFDGVLAFGEPIRRIYLDGFGVPRVWTFHEAADVSHFHPLDAERESDLLWIGNWGDEERTQELTEFFIAPVAELRNCRAVAYGVRYPEAGPAFACRKPELNIADIFRA